MATEVGAIAHLLDVTPEEVTPLQKEVHEIGRMHGIAVLVIATVVVVAVLILSETHTVDDVLRVLLLGVSLIDACSYRGLTRAGRLKELYGLMEHLVANRTSARIPLAEELSPFPSRRSRWHSSLGITPG